MSEQTLYKLGADLNPILPSEVNIDVFNKQVTFGCNNYGYCKLNFNKVSKVLYKHFMTKECFEALYTILKKMGLTVTNTSFTMTRQWNVGKYEIEGIDDGVVAYIDGHCMKIRVNIPHTETPYHIIEQDPIATNTFIFIDKAEIQSKILELEEQRKNIDKQIRKMKEFEYGFR